MIATRCERSDRDLVEAVRGGDDSAFEELYRRYHDRIAAYMRRMAGDARAEDLAQDAFFSALRRIRTSESEIAFKPWIYEIARNAAIDSWRRTSRAEEVSVDADEQLRPSDRGRLVGSEAPESALIDKERLDHLRGAFDELSDVHTRVLVMRELEGLSYREIGEKLELSRASVESALFRARRRLQHEYSDIAEGRRCEAMRSVMARLAEGLRDSRDEGRLARHARRCHTCRRRARELGVEPLAPRTRLRQKAAALLPLPFITRRATGSADGAASGGQAAGGGLSGLMPAGAQVGATVAERAVALVAAAAIAGAGGVALSGADSPRGDRDRAAQPTVEERSSHSSGQARGGADESTPRNGSARGRAGADDASPRSAPQDKSDAGNGSGRQEEGGSGPAGQSGGGQGGTGESALPGLPSVPNVNGGAPRGPSSDAPDLPAPPDVPPPPPPPPAAPRIELPQATPRVEAAPPPPVETGPQLEGVTGPVTDPLG